jgi:hypothetical protein
VDSPREYRLDRASVFKYQVWGAAALVLAVFVLSKPIADGQTPGVVGSVLGIGVLGVACWWLLARRPSRYAIELSVSGVRRSADGKWVPWSSLGRLAERVLAQRVDLVDSNGERFASLHYRLQSFPEALAQAVEGLNRPLPPADTFRSSVRPWQIALAVGSVGLVAWAGAWGDRLLLLALLFAAAVYTLFFGLRSVSATPEGLTLRTHVRTRRLPWSEIAAVRFALRKLGRGHRQLEVVVVSSSGRATRVRPSGADPFELYARIRAELGARTQAF